MTAILLGGRGMDCNQFLLKDPKSNAYDMVDAGLGMDFERVLAEVAAVTDPRRIRTIAITHEHLDHVNGIPHWQKLGAKVAASPACANKLLAGHDPTSAMFGNDIPTIEVDHVVHDGEDLQLGAGVHKVLITPGHSPGSACYWDETSGSLFSGDTVFAQGGIGRFDFPDGDLQELARSILRLGELPVQHLHCGHGPSVTDGAQRSVQGSIQHVRACLAQS